MKKQKKQLAVVKLKKMPRPEPLEDHAVLALLRAGQRTLQGIKDVHEAYVRLRRGK